MGLESMSQRNLYRGPSSSKEFNQRNQSLIVDMENIFQLLNQNEESIEENMDIVLRENFFLQNHISLLRNEVNRLNELVENKEERENETGTASNIFIQNFYTTNQLKNGVAAKASLIDRMHGLVTPLPTDVSSKLNYTTDGGTVFVPNDLEIFVKEAKNTVYDEAGNLVYYDLNNAQTKAIVDKDKNTFWVRDISFDQTDSVTEVFGELHIKLPVKGMNNLYANALTIHPYPEGSMRIRDIQYKGYGDQWSRLENYPTEMQKGIEVPRIFENTRKSFFQFSRTEMTELRIFYSQPYWFENSGKSTFSYGFQGIDLEYRIYTEKSCEFVSVIDLTEKKAVFQSIAYPEAIASESSEHDLVNLVEHHLYYDESMETEFDFETAILSHISKIYVKTVLKKEGDAVPVLKEVRISYVFIKEKG